MRLWRIATETRTFVTNDLSGKGAAISPGRWNGLGQAVVYAAPTVALVMLEIAAHVNTLGLPINRFLVAIDVPDAVWAQRHDMAVDQLPLVKPVPTWAHSGCRVKAAWCCACPRSSCRRSPLHSSTRHTPWQASSPPTRFGL